jgi:carbamoyltransferase
MFNLGFFGSHNASIAISYEGKVLEVIELERWLSKKNAGLFYYENPELCLTYISEIKKYLENKYKAYKYDNVIFNSVNDNRAKEFDANNYIFLSHHQAHAYCGLYQSPYQEALIISFDGGSDEGFFNIFIGSKNNDLKKIYTGTTDYAISYMTPAHFIEEIKQENIFIGNLVYAGKLMGLAGYGEVNINYIDKLKTYYKSNIVDNIPNAVERFIKLFSDIGINGWDSRINGKVAVDLAATNQYVFEELFFEEIDSYLKAYPNLPIIITGGCGLNVLNNTRLAKSREVFVPPNPNDAGLALGLLCSKVKPQGKPIDVTYIGSPALDRSELSKNLLERNGKPLNTTKLVTYILNGKIIGVVRDGSEHGPRALGNRSILCDPTFENMKDILNKKVKNREFYRPFAPVVRLEDVNKYFEWDKESRWMSFCPKVRKEYQSILKSITHIDGTARVQTVTPEQNNFLYNLLTELDKQKGIGVLLNTSFNIAGKPILNTYKDALWMLDNTQMDALVLEDYFIEKNY